MVGLQGEENFIFDGKCRPPPLFFISAGAKKETKSYEVFHNMW